jgi:hypothetical protein
MTNSLIDEIDATSVIGEIAALRAYSRKSILVVEGPSDLTFFSAFITHEGCDVVVSYGRPNAIEAVRRICGIHDGVLAVVDQDLDALFEGAPSHENIIITDDTDLEVMMIRSAAFDRVVWELGSLQKIKELTAKGLDPRGLILNAARRIFILKYISRKEKLNLKFKELRLNFVNSNLEYSTEAMVVAVLNHSRKLASNARELAATVDDLEQSEIDQWSICSGHILCSFLGRALQRVIGTINSNSAKVEEIESRLRIAFSDWHFRSTVIFGKIRDWEGKNAPYVILRYQLSEMV